MLSVQVHPFRASFAFVSLISFICSVNAGLLPCLLANVGQRLPEDEEVAETLEDSSCIRLQKRIRGNVGRAYAAWYKGSIQQVSIRLSSRFPILRTTGTNQHRFCPAIFSSKAIWLREVLWYIYVALGGDDDSEGRPVHLGQESYEATPPLERLSQAHAGGNPDVRQEAAVQAPAAPEKGVSCSLQGALTGGGTPDAGAVSFRTNTGDCSCRNG